MSRYLIQRDKELISNQPGLPARIVDSTNCSPTEVVDFIYAQKRAKNIRRRKVQSRGS
jgi:hypothetical protein